MYLFFCGQNVLKDGEVCGIIIVPYGHNCGKKSYRTVGMNADNDAQSKQSLTATCVEGKGQVDKDIANKFKKMP
jgi:hypothetical protein